MTVIVVGRLDIISYYQFLNNINYFQSGRFKLFFFYKFITYEKYYVIFFIINILKFTICAI